MQVHHVWIHIRTCLVLLIAACILGGLASSSSAQGEIWVDRVEEQGRILVPIRGVFEAFGAQVRWNSPKQEIEIRCGGTRILMYIDDHEIFVNGRTCQASIPPRIVRSRAYVPLRFVGEALGGKVSYHGSYVSIAGPKGYDLKVNLLKSGSLPGYKSPTAAYIAGWTSSREATDNDLRGLSNWELTLMREEISARRRKPFVEHHIRSYFLRQSWYSPDYSFSERWLMPLERFNINKILSYQKRVYDKPAARP
jgi:hypothetical protein